MRSYQLKRAIFPSVNSFFENIPIKELPQPLIIKEQYKPNLNETLNKFVHRVNVIFKNKYKQKIKNPLIAKWLYNNYYKKSCLK
jgi:hypothetical protein